MLPPELRLQVYVDVIKSCLATGEVSALRGLMFSCHRVYNELKIDCLPKVQPLIDIMVNWQAHHPDHSPLLVQLPDDCDLSTAPKATCVSVPSSMTWVSSGPYDAIAHPSFNPTIVTLYPLLTELPWSTITLSSHLGTQPQPSTSTYTPQVFFLNVLISLVRIFLITNNIRRVDHLAVLFTQDNIGGVSEEQFRVRAESIGRTLNDLLQSYLERKIHSTMVTKTLGDRTGLELGFPLFK